MDQDLFDQKVRYEHSKFVKEVVKVLYEKDYYYLYNCAKFLSYYEFKDLKQKVINGAVDRSEVGNTEAAKQKYWERIVRTIEEEYSFKRPVSPSPDAARKRRDP
jgi:hypothetical protein